MGFPGGSESKNLPAMQETHVQPLVCWEGLEKGMETHSNGLIWRIPMDRGAWQAIIPGGAESDATERLSTTTEDFRPT